MLVDCMPVVGSTFECPRYIVDFVWCLAAWRGGVCTHYVVSTPLQWGIFSLFDGRSVQLVSLGYAGPL